MYAALLHDVGKAFTTKKGEDGLYHASNHAIKSAEIAKDLLVKLEVDEHLHTAIISLVRWHMQPMYILEQTNPEKAILKLANNLNEVNVEIVKLKNDMKQVQTQSRVIKNYGGASKASAYGKDYQGFYIDSKK